MRSFSIGVHADFDLSEDEVWPDGDGPENPTPADVIAAMKKHGPRRHVLSDWQLDDVVVDVDGVEVDW